MKGRCQFDDDQVREMLRLRRKRIPPARIAEAFGTQTLTVTRILTGRTYRHVTHDDAPDRVCGCPACETARLGEDNLTYIRGLLVTRPCMFCHRPATVTVARGLAAHGLFPCADCDGRKQ